MQPYSEINQVQINPKVQTTDQSTRAFSPKEFNSYKITRHSEANLRHSINFLSFHRRRAGWLDEFVQVDPVSNPSGGSNESLHEGLESPLAYLPELLDSGHEPEIEPHQRRTGQKTSSILEFDWELH